MESSSPEARSGRVGQLLITALLVVWIAAVVGYSLWPNRPGVTFDHVLAIGVAALAVASGLASLLLVGRHRIQLATGINISLVRFGLPLELAQGKYMQAERDGTVVTTVAFETEELIGSEFAQPLTLGDEATGDRRPGVHRQHKRSHHKYRHGDAERLRCEEAGRATRLFIGGMRHSTESSDSGLARAWA